MNVQRCLGFLLIVLQAVALAYFFRTPIFSLSMIATAVVGLVSRIRPLSQSAARRWPIVLAAIYIVQRVTMPPGWYSSVSSFLFPEACLIAEYLLVFQVGQFFVQRDGDRLPSYLPILAILAIAFTGDVQVSPQGRVIFQSLTLGLVALAVGFFAACRLPRVKLPTDRLKTRIVLLGVVLFVGGASGWIMASNLHRHARQIESLLGRVMNPPSEPMSAGFSGKGKLGSVARQKGTSAKRVALRAIAENPPGYLRGKAFDTYARGQWHIQAQQETLTADSEGEMLPATAEASDNLRTFMLRPSVSDSTSLIEVWPNQSFREVLFTPSDTIAVQAPVDQLSINVHGIVATESLPSGVSYTIWTSSTQPVTNGDWQHLTKLSQELDPRIAELAKRITAGCTSASDKIEAVQRHFLNTYRYRFGIQVPDQTDPLTYFLLEKPPPAAHCEYFASGAVVLLRAAGVPSRYVTGYVVAERNTYGGYWIARNRDAHAWAEAFDPAHGWVLVEATPAAGVPQQTSASPASQMWGAFHSAWQRLAAAIRQRGFAVIVQAIGRWIKQPIFLAVLMATIVVFACRRLWRRRRGSPQEQQDPWVEQSHKLLHRMDQQLRKAGLIRRPHETLHQFAQRLECAATGALHPIAAQWYRQYAAIRYGGRVNPDTVQTLEKMFAETANDSQLLQGPVRARV